MTSPTWLTTAQAATHLGLSQRTLENWRHRQQGPPWHKLQRTVRYDRAELDAWAQKEYAPSPPNTEGALSTEIIQTTVGQMMERIVNDALHQAQLHDTLRQAQARIAQLEGELEQLRQHNARLHTSCDQIKQRSLEVGTQLQQLQKEHDTSKARAEQERLQTQRWKSLSPLRLVGLVQNARQQVAICEFSLNDIEIDPPTKPGPSAHRNAKTLHAHLLCIGQRWDLICDPEHVGRLAPRLPSFKCLPTAFKG